MELTVVPSIKHTDVFIIQPTNEELRELEIEASARGLSVAHYLRSTIEIGRGM